MNKRQKKKWLKKQGYGYYRKKTTNYWLRSPLSARVELEAPHWGRRNYYEI